MKILHCIHLETPGGKEMHLYRCLKFEIENEGIWKHEILHTGDKIHETFKNFFYENYKIYNYKTLKGVRIPKLIRSYLLRKKTDLSHEANLFYEIQNVRLMNLFVSSAKGKNVFYDRGHSWFLNTQEAAWLHNFDFFFSNSKASKTMLNKRWDVPEDRIKIIHNSFSPEYLNRINHTDRNEIEVLKERYNLTGKKVVLYVGRFVTIKGIHSLIEALDYLPEKDLRLVLVGDGKIKKSMESLAKKKNQEDRVIFAGMQADTAPFYKMADVTIVPSAREPFGNVNLEAALAESPLIATKIDGIPEIIPDDSFGYLLNPKIIPSNYPYLKTSHLPDYVVNPDSNELTEPKFLDPEELASTIALVLEKEPEKAKEKTQKLKVRVQKNFSMKQRSNLFRQLMEEITQKTKSG